jgi:hypothetical protein
MKTDVYVHLSTRIKCDFKTGILIWKNNPHQKRNWNYRMEGTQCGTLDATGYVRLKVYIDGKIHIGLAHRLIFYMKYGYLPVNVDHINRIRNDNRLCNLRDATRQTNTYNSTLSKTNTSGYKGICWHKATKTWIARIGVNGTRIVVGRYTDIDVAYKELQKVRKKLHGKFATNGMQGE